MKKSSPKLGQKVLYYDTPDDRPCAAIVTHVTSDVVVNLCCFTHSGGVYAREAINFCRPSDEKKPTHRYCMPDR